MDFSGHLVASRRTQRMFSSFKGEGVPIVATKVLENGRRLAHIYMPVCLGFTLFGTLLAEWTRLDNHGKV